MNWYTTTFSFFSKQNNQSLSQNITFICARLRNRMKCKSRRTFLSCFAPSTNNFNILGQCMADEQSCHVIDSFLRGVYINVGEILNSDWLKSYIYFPYMPTQLIGKNVLKNNSSWSIVPVLNKYNYISSLKMLFLEEAILDVKEVRMLDHERILSCNSTFLQPHKGGRNSFTNPYLWSSHINLQW
jgi:hypothetical protein